MLNRILFLLVAVGAPTSAFAMLYVGAHPAAAVTLAERFPCLGMGVLALALAAMHARAAHRSFVDGRGRDVVRPGDVPARRRVQRAPLGAWVFVALLCLAGTSVVRLADRVRNGQRAPSAFQRRIFA